MERRMVSMNWDELQDLDANDEFFESTNRMSAVVPLDMPLSEGDDPLLSSAMEIQNVTVASNGKYDMWMMAPGSITDRRRKLLQGMGLNSNKDFARLSTAKFNKASTKRLVSRGPADFTPLNVNKTNDKPVEQSSANFKESKQEDQKPPQTQPPPEAQPQKPEAQHHDGAQASVGPVLLVRCRSDGDIDTSSFSTKRRKEDMIGCISKQRLTRTSSELVASSVGLSCQYVNILRVSRSSASPAPNKKQVPQATVSRQLDSFFLIKNLDTGKEFVVKESNEEGMWNKVSDLQTGKQLTMDEFEKTVGHSPVVKELMRRESKKNGNASKKFAATNSLLSKSFRSSKKKGAAILKNLRGSMSMSRTAERDKQDDNTATTTDSSSCSEQKTSGGQKPATDKNPTSEWVKARAYGKAVREFSALHLCQEIKAHDGSIWTMRFNFDGHYLASAGEDKVIHVWEVQECDVMSMTMDKSSGTTPDNRPPLPDNAATPSDKKKKGKNNKKKRGIPDYAKVPETMFGLSEKPVCTFSGHQDDVLDLSWSRSQLLLSSSMDKTVRLWNIETNNCLKKFAHRDYVTCIQFNPTDDDYFISGSLDAKVRLWSVSGRKVIDWSDLHDMITSVCYSPDGQGAIVGLHKGNCKSYSITDCKLQQKDQQIELYTKPKAEPKKITGFQFSPLNPSEVLVTSADSRVRIVDGSYVVNKLIGYKNTNSQFSAQYSADGKYIICASEDSQVYIWKHEKPKTTGGAKPKYITTTSYESFPCTEVTVVAPWQREVNEIQPKRAYSKSSSSPAPSPLPTEKESEQADTSGDGSEMSTPSNNLQSTAWGLVIVTAGVGGEIRVYQNVGLPRR